ncbi:MAG: hypothetical protein WD689_06160 [Gaiellaceae bacterium]
MRRLRAFGRRVEEIRPAFVLAPLLAAHLAVVVVVAAQARHNGWLYGTDAGGHDWTAAWALGHLWATDSGAWYGLAALLWPAALAFGGSLPAALPVVVVAQVLVGGTAILLATYGIGARIGGRLLGYAAALGWVLAPVLSLGFFYGGDRVFQGVPYSDFRGLVRDIVVPHALGLTSSAAFVSLVALTVAAWLLVRSLDTGDSNDVVLAALAAGFALGVDPANAVFVPGVLVALGLARRWRHALAFLGALLPAAAALALWKAAGSGELPALPGFGFDLETLRINSTHLRGGGWSLLVVLWIAVAGSYGLVRKAPAKGTLVAAWLAGFFVVLAGVPESGSVLAGTIFPSVQPGYAALVLLGAGSLLLVPGWGRPTRAAAAGEHWSRPSVAVAAAVLALGVYPLVLVGLASPVPPDRIVVKESPGRSVPVSAAFHLRAEGAALSWTAPAAAGTKLSYRIYRSPGPGCARAQEGSGECLLRMAGVGLVRGTTWTDLAPGFSYRVAALADYRVDRAGGDLLLISPPVRAG